MKELKFLFIAAILSTLMFTSCSENPEDEVEELITTVEYTLTPSDGSAQVSMTFRDTDGDGTPEELATSGPITAGVTYAGALEFWNETEDPMERVTEEIEEEDDEHQVFFQSTLAGLSVGYADLDENGLPVGLLSTVVGTTAGQGSLTITLRHEPAKTADGVEGGDITNAAGETDIEVTFDIEVR